MCCECGDSDGYRHQHRNAQQILGFYLHVYNGKDILPSQILTLGFRFGF
jgi:hypothetical protein